MSPIGILTLICFIAGSPAAAQSDSTISRFSGVALHVMSADGMRVPLLAWHAGQIVDGHFLLPDINVSLLVLPIPVLMTVDPHVGLATRSRDGRATFLLTAGPSVIVPLFGSDGFIYGLAAGAGVMVRSDDTHSVRFDVGRRFYPRLSHESPAIWYFSISFLSTSGERDTSCPCGSP